MPVILGTWGEEIGGFWFKASPGKKVSKTVSEDKLSMVVYTSNPSYVRGRSGRIVV
jgi:hypothetical protein